MQQFGILPPFNRCSPAALLRVTGPDALEFLQGQFTQELRPSRAEEVAYGLWLNQKGRVLADSHILRMGPEEWWVFSTESGSAVIRERLEGYLIADDVVIEDLLPAWTGAIVVGDAGRGWLEQQGAKPPAPGEIVRCGAGVVFVGRRGVVDAWELLVPAESEAVPAWPEAAPTALERARIAAGIPAVPRDLGPNDLPQEAGLDQIAISYTKGCYLGQEVMARLNAMGRVRRRLLRVAGQGSAAPAAGVALFQKDKTVGELRSAIDDGLGGWIGLAMFSLLNLDREGPVAHEPAVAATITVMSEAAAS